MRTFAMICFASMFALQIASAETVKISEDRGGQIGAYIITYSALRHNDDRVVIDGNCLSACTLLLGIVRRSNICATPRARFGFHAAWMPNENGVPVTSRLGTEALWVTYPADIKRWISRHGGLKRKMIFLEGANVFRYVHSCDEAPRSPAMRASKRHHLARTANARAH